MSPRIYTPSYLPFAEDPERYKENGLHPAFATTWLDRDTLAHRYVSLKILSADTSLDCKGLCILRDITNSKVAHEGRLFVIRLLDDFVIQGPNSKHLCLVMVLAGDRLARKSGLPFDSLEWSRIIGLQLVKALQYLHNLSITHGDCYTSNILLQLLAFDKWSEEDVLACLGQPVKHQVRRSDGKLIGDSAPQYTVSPGDVSALGERPSTGRILLIDFGEAFYHHDPSMHVYTPAPLAAPEILFHGEITSAVDKWAFGCLVYELCAGHTLIKLLFGWNNDAQKDLVAMLGKPPELMWHEWKARQEYFHPDGTPKNAQERRLKVRSLSLEQQVRNLTKPLSDPGYETGVAEPLPTNFQKLDDLLASLIVYDTSGHLSFEEI
ncbi:uncharacterized protein E0L32_005784 [Thyridium curvatum]|uniref:Protein kinase domain-containing protein n=1 Tax=Thyridium curvatum TaxID=1093900 RepID=A0A507BB65_9PEZI|nr:uncharacterized protein E0L32_005784 [Thyridium curvatum]TPX13840.1 hypothetical protein E0L32_005784 [Thyridium curvatum]